MDEPAPPEAEAESESINARKGIKTFVVQILFDILESPNQ